MALRVRAFESLNERDTSKIWSMKNSLYSTKFYNHGAWSTSLASEAEVF